MLSACALLIAGVIQFSGYAWVHIVYLPFLIGLTLFFGPETIIPLSLMVPPLEIRHLLGGNRMEEVSFSAGLVLTVSVLSVVLTRIKKEGDMVKKSLSKLRAEADDIGSGTAMETISGDGLISQHLSSSKKTDEEIGEILLLAKHLLSADSVSMFALKGNALTLRISTDDQQKAVSDRGPVEVCIERRASVVSGANPARIATPVLDGNFVAGVLTAQRSSAGTFEHADIRTLEMLSYHVMRILHRQRIYAQITREHAGLKILNEGSSSLIGSLKVDVIARSLIESAYRIAPLSIAFFLSRGTLFELIHQVGLVPPEDRLVDFRNSLIAMAVRNREPLYFSDLKNNRVPALPFKSGNPASIFMLPLVYEKEPLGMLIFLSEKTGMLNSYQLELLEVLGNQAASSLVNAKFHSEIERMAITDGLTGLYNHRHFQEELSSEFRRLERFSDPFSLLLVDIDFFKKVNDSYGHPAGDEILRRVSGIMRETVRNIDICARYGGEEFAAILLGTNHEGARKMAERLRRAVMEKTFSLDGKDLRVTVSIGSATSPRDAGVKEELIGKADKALYHAKRNGRNRCVLWNDIKGV
jgi:diguanylate cyclase (GGDEF)-like protein